MLEASEDGLYNGKQALARYDHTPISTVIAECAAWQLAKHLGEPWSEVAVPTVMKFPRLPDADRVEVGGAALFRGGNAGKQGFYQVVPELAAAGAFFDALIGQQDRNKGNVLWYPERDTIYLIDHSFSFRKAGGNRGSSDLIEWRWNHGNQELGERQLEVLRRLLESEDTLTLARFVAPERGDALHGRAEQMFGSRRLVRDLG